MFEYIPIKKQLLKERAKNARTAQENAKNAANIDYIAMMCDVELENEETEESDNEQEI